jgi:PGF-pre-PGF domain-containing protein
MKKFYAFLIFVVLLSGITFSETTGNINLTQQNLTSPPVTGVFGYTVQYCNATSDCSGYSCFIDYDSVSSGTSAGWCFDSSITGCYHNDVLYAHGYVFCYSSTSYMSCSSGTWSAATSCGANSTCSSGACSTPNTTTTTGGTGSSGTTSSTLNKVSYGAITASTVKSGSFNTTIHSISFRLKASVTGAYLQVVSFETIKPSSTSTPTGSVYRYMQINSENISDANVQNAYIRFKVDKAWLTNNNLTYSDVKLLRYASAWTTLSTTKIGETTAEYEFEATTPGFSYFAIIGSSSTTPTAICGNAVCETGEDSNNCLLDCPLINGTVQTGTGILDTSANNTGNATGNQTGGESMPIDMGLIIAAIVVIVIIGIVVYYFFLMPKKYSYKTKIHQEKPHTSKK